MHKKIGNGRFKTLAKELANNDIKINYMVDWGGDMSETDQPRLGTGSYTQGDGWYFTKSDRNDFNAKEKKVIKDIFKRKDFKVVSINDGEMEHDDDRYFYPTISFILNK